MKFTPGPWKVDNFGGQPCIVPADAKKRAIGGIYQSGEYIATIHDTIGKTKTANARLIAAGPKMYKLLEQAASLLCTPGDGHAALVLEMGRVLVEIDGEE